MKISKIINSEFLKFIGVGVINTVAGMSIIFVFYNIFHFGYWISSASNYIFGSIISYFLNRKFTFKNENKISKTAVRFVISTVVLYFVSYSVAKPAVAYILSPFGEKIKTNAALLAGAVIFTLLNFFSQKFFVFYKK